MLENQFSTHDSKTESNLHDYIDILSKGRVTLPLEHLVTYLCDCSACIGYGINVITFLKRKERKNSSTTSAR